MTNPTIESSSTPQKTVAQRPVGWVKVAAVAAASALAGGLAAAWWHRKTLAKLKQGEDRLRNPEIRISDHDPHDEI